MEIEYSKISLYLELFDLVREIGVLPDYQNISIIVNDDYSCLLYFNANEIISYKKLKRILFKKKYIPKNMPSRYTAVVFDKLNQMLKTDIRQKYELFEDGINYNTGRLIVDENEQYKLARIFYIDYETPLSENISKVNLVHFASLVDEYLIQENTQSDEIEHIKETYLRNTEAIKNRVDYYNKTLRKIRRIRKKIKA